MSDHDFGSFDDHQDPSPYDESPDTPLYEHDVWSQHDDDAHGGDFSGHDDSPPGYGSDVSGHDDGLAEFGSEPAAHEVDPSSHDVPEMPETQAAHGDGWDDGGHAAWDDPDAAAADHVDVFPPALDVGDLPEPVDGFPWIDTGSLGVVDPGVTAEHLDPVRPEELAAYAGEDLPPGQDPWAVLADSDDPATSALARWWHQN